MKMSGKNLLSFYLLFIVSIGVRFPLLSAGMLNWHDMDLMAALDTGSPWQNYLSGGGESGGWYLLAWLQHSIGGHGYFIYHAVSILLHTGTVLLFFTALLRFGVALRTALTSALLFSLHPLQTEPVGWFTQQPLLLAAFLWLGVVHLYLSHVQGRGRWWWIASLAAASALFSLLPSLLTLITIGTLHRRHRSRTLRSTAYAILPFLFLFAAASVVSRPLGAIVPAFLRTAGESLAVLQSGPRTVWEFLYPFFPPHFHQPADGMMGIVSAAAVLLAGVAVWSFVRNEASRMGALLALLLSLPVVTGVSFGDTVWTHSVWYLSLLPVAYLTVSIVERIGALLPGVWKRIAIVPLTAAVLLMSHRSYQEGTRWSSSETFWNTLLEHEPENLFALDHLSMSYYVRAEYEKALAAAERGVSVSPGDITMLFRRASVEYQLMSLDRADADLRRVLSHDSTHVLAWYHLALVHGEYGRHDSVVAFCSKALAVRPDFIPALNNRGNAYAQSGRYVLARRDYDRIIGIDPSYADAYGNRALLSLQTGNTGNAISDFNRYIRLVPQSFRGYIHLGLAQVLASDSAEASLAFFKVSRLDSRKGEMYLNAVASTFLRSVQEWTFAERVLHETGITLQHPVRNTSAWK